MTGPNPATDPTINFTNAGDVDPSNPTGGQVQFGIKPGVVDDAKISPSGITTRSKLPGAIAYEDEANTWSLNQTFTGTLAIGGTGSFSISGSTSGVITFARAAATGTWTWYWPTSAGTSGQPLLSAGGATPMTFGTLGLAAGGTNRSTPWTGDRCVRVNAAGTALEPATADCGTGAGAPDQAASYTWTGAHSWRDNNFTILDNVDPTKGIQFQLAGITAGQTRVYTTPNVNTNLLGGSDLGATVQGFDADLSCLAALGTTGLFVRTGAGSCLSRQITVGTGLDVTNGTGVGGDPLLAVNSAVAMTTRAGVFGAFLYDFGGSTVKMPLSAANLPLTNGLFGIQTTANQAQVVMNGVLRRFVMDGADCPAGPVTFTALTVALGCGIYPTVSIVVSLQTGTTYNVLDADRGTLLTFSNASPVAVVLPDPEGAGFDATWYTYIQNRGAGTVTITPTTSSIDGTASIVLSTNQGIAVVSDGVNYYTLRGKPHSVSLTADVTGVLPAANVGVLDAAKITTGLLPLARGGTNQGTWTAGRLVQVNAAGTALEVAAGGFSAVSPTASTVPFTPAGTIAGTNVQTAIEEVRNESFTQRTFQDQTNVFTWVNPDGLAGNPTGRVANSLIDGSSRIAADAGSSDDYVACPQSISTMSTPAYVDRSIHGFRANTANTGPATINYCALGSRALVKLIGGIATPLATGDILVGQSLLTVYSAGNSTFQIISPLASAPSGAGIPSGPLNSCQYNKDGVFAGDAGCTYDDAGNVLTVAGGYVAGNVATNSVNTVMGGGVSGARTYTQERNTDMAYAGTATGATLTPGAVARFNAQGLLVPSTPDRVAQFIIGADNGAALTNTDDQASIFYNHLGQGITINSVWCQADATGGGGPTIQLQKDDGSPTNMLSSDLACATAGGTTATGFVSGENAVASQNRVNFIMATAGGTAKRVTVSIRYTLD